MTDYYINPTHPNASDGNAGTDPEQPWENLSAMDAVTLDDTVTLAGGSRFVEKWAPNFSAFGGTPDATTVGILVKVDTGGLVWSGQTGKAFMVKPDVDFDNDTEIYLRGDALPNSPGFNGIQHLTVEDVIFVSPDCYHGIWIEQDSARERRITFRRCREISPNFVNPGFYGFLYQKNNGSNDIVVTLEDCVIEGVWGWGHRSGTTGGDCILIAVNTVFRGQYDPVGWLTDGGIFYGVQCTVDGLNIEWMRSQLAGEAWNVKGCYFLGGQYCMPAQGSVTWDADGSNLFQATRDLIVSGGALPGNGGAEVFARIEPDYGQSEMSALPGSADDRVDFAGAKSGQALDPADTDAFPIAAINWPDSDISGRDRASPILRDAGAIEGAACGGGGVSVGSLASLTGTVVLPNGSPNEGAVVLLAYISGVPGQLTPTREPQALATDANGVWQVQVFKGATYHIRIYDNDNYRWESRTVLIGTDDSQIYESLADA